jgi:hypothetical protein
MTEAVRTRSRHIVLGSSFTDWMRRLGMRTISYGPRGSATLIREQLDRLLACEWMIRWDNENSSGDKEFAVKEVKLTSDYAGVNTNKGNFSREILLTEGFFEHLREHAVPLDENAIRQLRDSATALDLYTWLAYRLPRISKGRPALLSWPQLATHFGNEGNNIRKFRQTIRDAWERHVSAVYPEARADFDTTVIRLHPSPAPLQRRVLRLVVSKPEQRAEALMAAEPSVGDALLAAFRSAVGDADARAWLSEAAVETDEDGTVIVLATRFKADYVRQNYSQQIERAAKACNLSVTPTVRARPRAKP